MSALAFGSKAGRDKRMPAVVDAIKRWTRAALAIGTETVVSVNELACAQPRCPPRETIVLVLREGTPARKLSVHKAMVDLTEEDVVSGWRLLATEQACGRQTPAFSVGGLRGQPDGSCDDP